MTDLSMQNTDPPVQEGDPPDLSKLQIDDNDKEICLSDLNQCYIDGICKHLDLKSVIRLQLTCKNLYQKGFIAQRLVTLPVKIFYRNRWNGYNQVTGKAGFNFHAGNRSWTEEKFQTANFHFKAEFHYYWFALTLDIMKQFNEALEGRGTINKIKVVTVHVGDDYAYFNKFLQDWNVSELEVQFIPQEYLLHVPSFKKLNILRMDAVFTLPLNYFLETDMHTCTIYRGPITEDRPDSEEMHDVLEKWTLNEKVIKHFSIASFNWDAKILFDGWKIIRQGKAVPPERPFVIGIRQMLGWEFCLIRGDGTVLSASFQALGNTARFVEEDRPFFEAGARDPTEGAFDHLIFGP